MLRKKNNERTQIKISSAEIRTGIECLQNFVSSMGPPSEPQSTAQDISPPSPGKKPYANLGYEKQNFEFPLPFKYLKILLTLF